MARKRHSDEDILTLLREDEVHMSSGSDVATTRQAQSAIDQWLRQYNHTRPHQALNMSAPVPETIWRNVKMRGTDRGRFTGDAYALFESATLYANIHGVAKDNAEGLRRIQRSGPIFHATGFARLLDA